MNNKLTRQQAVKNLRYLVAAAKVSPENIQISETFLNNLEKAIEAIDDTHEGFSNRETWEAYYHLVNNDADYHRMAMKAARRGDLEYLARLAGEVAASDIGSLWRVNWDEVAAALQGGEG